MKIKPSKIFPFLIGIILIIIAIKDFSPWRSPREIIIGLLTLAVALCSTSKNQKSTSSEIDYLVDHKVVIYSERIYLTMFFVFMVFYYLDGKNILLGVISIYSLLLWLIQQVIIIVLELLKSKRK
ncbi:MULTISPECIES: hypothetical protein [unclassified Lactobacillus]|jgi:hypothetical protein|uniref:hypothetical protein n=1 Tax=unclassified Lactobacillus TaxID=2620435 RepID=UPI000EFC8B0E|nr:MULTISPECIES: hypothetical protein [unclassified Lactobacillus]RMC26043.1 hypothetical protein F5ESL0247_00600 [Lactobacillus sp. ESL0247]RMC29736.1 hypothetical protein F5ESL0246_00600 [Lactobacillus sp. ESL0246]RMC34141.1 hypothetical protein F5ESL0245_00600 [Lactobacillus sp. ESL0245]RMC51924.1 hypothetical protein F5ESL0228_00495 [Lactobacillus sp. ESL0228]